MRTLVRTFAYRECGKEHRWIGRVDNVVLVQWLKDNELIWCNVAVTALEGYEPVTLEAFAIDVEGTVIDKGAA